MSSSSNLTQQTGKTKDDIPGLKNKMAELERQVNDYKIKFDELRRAKAATTVVKTEKEYVNATAPGTSRTEKIKCDKCDELESMVEAEKQSNKELKKQIDQKDSNKKTSSSSTAAAKTTVNSGPCPKCPTAQELLDNQKERNSQIMDQILDQEKQTQTERNAKELLEHNLSLVQSQLVEVKHKCEKLQRENQEYQNECEKMKKIYADKMAELCRQEEEAKKQIATWEQMYTEWMSTMEKRVNNLQTTNKDLNSWVHDDEEMSPHRRPGGNQRR
ncbi:unnamed protein product [Adineta steineri]|uniref:Uncharacterized protein n=1 Tax=Adineta steineri TaxID=433720 RepID=A0A819H7G6_9BILA|nr:unnamed protein product [Adineta steineri]